MKVEELSQYGKTLSGLPREAIKKMHFVISCLIKKELRLNGN